MLSQRSKSQRFNREHIGEIQLQDIHASIFRQWFIVSLFPVAVPIPNSTVAQRLVDDWLSFLGITATILIYRVTQFKSILFNEITDLLGYSAAANCHPKVNGMVEWLHCTLKTFLMAQRDHPLSLSCVLSDRWPTPMLPTDPSARSETKKNRVMVIESTSRRCFRENQVNNMHHSGTCILQSTDGTINSIRYQSAWPRCSASPGRTTNRLQSKNLTTTHMIGSNWNGIVGIRFFLLSISITTMQSCQPCLNRATNQVRYYGFTHPQSPLVINQKLLLLTQLFHVTLQIAL